MSFAMHLKLCGKLFLAFFACSAVAGLDQDPGLAVWMSKMEVILVLDWSSPHLKTLMFVSVWQMVCNQDLPKDTHHSLSNLSTIVAKLFVLEILLQD